MVDFNKYETTTLKEVAEYQRAKQGQIYPAGCTTIQISATRGQIGFLDSPCTVSPKDVVITPRADINPRYFNAVLIKNIDVFLSRYATGINIKESEIGNFPIELHSAETQKAAVRMLGYIDKEIELEQSQVDFYKSLKQTQLDKMFV